MTEERGSLGAVMSGIGFFAVATLMFLCWADFGLSWRTPWFWLLQFIQLEVWLIVGHWLYKEQSPGSLTVAVYRRIRKRTSPPAAPKPL